MSILIFQYFSLLINRCRCGFLWMARYPPRRNPFLCRYTTPGSLDLDMISLFPKDTWKNRPNGMRADLVQLLADMKPGPGRLHRRGAYPGRTFPVEENHR
jgi:hypothetical protein